ncbi:Protein RRP5, partial [Coemansia nantahalensis]
FAEGQPVEAVVVEDPAGDDLEKTRLRLSVRPSAVSPDTVPASSIVDPVIESAADLGVGQVVHGFVRQTTERGCFVALGRSMCARALISELSDEYVRDVKAAFPAGKFVTAVVTGVDAAANHAALSLRASKVGTAVGPDGTPKRRLELVAVGEVLKGTVTRIEDYGLFVRPDDVFTTGLCYVREIADSEVPANPRALYEIGDRVLAKVLKVDLDKDRLSLGLKSSYFADDAAAGSDSEAAGESGEESADEEDELSAGEHSGSEEIGSEDSDSEDAESDDESDSDSEESEQGSDSDTEANDLALAVAGGFRWNDDDEDAEAGAGESADSG